MPYVYELQTTFAGNPGAPIVLDALLDQLKAAAVNMDTDGATQALHRIAIHFGRDIAAVIARAFLAATQQDVVVIIDGRVHLNIRILVEHDPAPARGHDERP